MTQNNLGNALADLAGRSVPRKCADDFILKGKLPDDPKYADLKSRATQA